MSFVAKAMGPEITLPITLSNLSFPLTQTDITTDISSMNPCGAANHSGISYESIFQSNLYNIYYFNFSSELQLECQKFLTYLLPIDQTDKIYLTLLLLIQF